MSPLARRQASADRAERTLPSAPAPQRQASSANLNERAAYLSNRELHDIVQRCEQVILRGSARIEDYEAFVICQQELSHRR